MIRDKILWKIGSRKRGRPNRRWIHSIKEAMGLSLQEQSRAVENRTLWTSFIHGVARSQKQLNASPPSCCLDQAVAAPAAILGHEDQGHTLEMTEWKVGRNLNP